ncbi:MAG: hypothetical protein NVS1B14_04070 [Vulcanimicrobiaceae bacterium]
MMRPTRAEMYAQACEQLQEAVDILDQARSLMRQARTMAQCRVATRGLDELLKELKAMKCEDCDEQLPCKCAWIQERP